MSPAAQWVPELRAASKQFGVAVRMAEVEIQKLQGTALEGLNSPTRTSTGAPTDLFEILLTFGDAACRSGLSMCGGRARSKQSRAATHGHCIVIANRPFARLQFAYD